MDIKFFSLIKKDTNSKFWNLFRPVFGKYNSTIPLSSYKVEKWEEMRIDLVMMNMYDDVYQLQNIDVLLFINNISNPLNIKEGDVLVYPVNPNDFDSYRIQLEDGSKIGKRVRDLLSIPNKTTRKDNNRKKFLENSALPPVVNDVARPPVRLEDGKIKIGGLN